MVFCWDPTKGEIIDKIQLPIPNVTSCCFGGKDLDQILITSAMENLSKEDVEKYPLSGNTFIVKSKTQGFLPNKFNLS